MKSLRPALVKFPFFFPCFFFCVLSDPFLDFGKPCPHFAHLSFCMLGSVFFPVQVLVKVETFTFRPPPSTSVPWSLESSTPLLFLFLSVCFPPSLLNHWSVALTQALKFSGSEAVHGGRDFCNNRDDGGVSPFGTSYLAVGYPLLPLPVLLLVFFRLWLRAVLRAFASSSPF